MDDVRQLMALDTPEAFSARKLMPIDRVDARLTRFAAINQVGAAANGNRISFLLGWTFNSQNGKERVMSISTPSLVWKIKDRTLDLSCRGVIMGILNLTFDSFFDGGRFTEDKTLNVDAAVAHAQAMEAAGAEIIDIGGESTRPGAEPVSEMDELARVVPVLRALQGRLSKAVISIDTSKAAVAEAALRYGATIINDVTALRGDSGMAALAARTGAGVVLMHMQGTPRSMQVAPHYDDVVSEVRDFFLQATHNALQSGIDPRSITHDPGIGFGKTVEHNLTLLRELPRLRVGQHPLVLGVSRKTFLGKLMNDSDLEARFWPTIALTSLGREQGASVFRVHDVAANVQALKVSEAILEAAC